MISSSDVFERALQEDGFKKSLEASPRRKRRKKGSRSPSPMGDSSRWGSRAALGPKWDSFDDAATVQLSGPSLLVRSRKKKGVSGVAYDCTFFEVTSDVQDRFRVVY